MRSGGWQRLASAWYESFSNASIIWPSTPTWDGWSPSSASLHCGRSFIHRFGSSIDVTATPCRSCACGAENVCSGVRTSELRYRSERGRSGATREGIRSPAGRRVSTQWPAASWPRQITLRRAQSGSKARTSAEVKRRVNPQRRRDERFGSEPCISQSVCSNTWPATSTRSATGSHTPAYSPAEWGIRTERHESLGIDDSDRAWRSRRRVDSHAGSCRLDQRRHGGDRPAVEALRQRRSGASELIGSRPCRATDPTSFCFLPTSNAATLWASRVTRCCRRRISTGWPPRERASRTPMPSARAACRRGVP